MLLVLVIAGAALLRVWGLAFGLPHPFTRPDEEVIVDVALGVLSDRNPHFFDWPTLFMYLTAAAYAVLFLLYSNLPSVGANFHGVPKPLAFAYPLLLSVTLARDLLVRRQPLVVTPVL